MGILEGQGMGGQENVECGNKREGTWKWDGCTNGDLRDEA